MEIELKTKARTAKTFKRVTNLDSMLSEQGAHALSIQCSQLFASSQNSKQFTSVYQPSQHLFLTCSFTSLSQLLWLSESSQDPALPRLRHQHKESWNVVEPHILFKQAVKHWHWQLRQWLLEGIPFGESPNQACICLYSAWIGCICGSTWHTDPR